MWVLTATGDCPAAAERELHDRISAILASGKYGVTASQFGGGEVNGPAHDKPPKQKGAAAPAGKQGDDSE